MKIFKKFISLILAFILIITGLPGPKTMTGSQVHAAATVDIGFENFADPTGLQLNGGSLIADNSIRFESGGSTGKSVFTTDKIALGENLSFSTVFSFRNISPATPVAGTKGGFTFTLQQVGNSVAASDFQDESINPSLSIAFTSDYKEAPSTTRLNEQDTNLRLASLTDVSLATGSTVHVEISAEPSTLCEIYAEPYIDGDYNNLIFRQLIDSYYVADEASEYYHVWMGYDGVEKLLSIIYRDPSGGYNYFSDYLELADIFTGSEIYAGFMGSLGDAGNTSEIYSWFFNKDLSIIDEFAVEADEAWLTSEMEMLEAEPVEISSLPVIGQYGSTIQWASSNTDVVAEDGMVKPPSIVEGNQTVTLTATIGKGSIERVTRSFEVTFKVPDWDIATADFDWLTDSLILNENDALENIVSDLRLPTSGQYGSAISWSSTNTIVADLDGSVSRPPYFDGDEEVTLTAYIMMNSVVREKTFHIIVKAFGVSDAEIVDADKLWLTETQLLNGNSSMDKITKNLSLPTSGQYGSTISWESSDEGVVAADGTVSIPALAQGDQTVTLTATIISGESVTANTFTVTVMVKDEDRVFADREWLTSTLVLNGNSGLNNVVTNLKLPTFGINGSTISWTTSNGSLVDVNGKVTRPAVGSGNEQITLWATIRYEDAMPMSSFFTVTVRAIGLSDQEMANADKMWLTDDWIKNLNSTLYYVTSELNLRTVGGMYGSMISWESSDTSVVDVNGAVTRPTATQGNKVVTLTATIRMGDAPPETKTFAVNVIAHQQTDEEKYAEDEEKVSADNEWLVETVILNGNSALNNVTGALNLPVVGENGSVISWVSTDTAVVNTNGTVVRPTYTQGDQMIILTATIRSGTVTPLTKSFTVAVKALEQTEAEKDEEKVNADNEWLMETVILNGNSALNYVTGALNLPIEGQNGSVISWVSTDTAFINTNGTVVRPTYTQGDQMIILTATIRSGTVTPLTKSFTVAVKALEQTEAEKDEEKVNADNEWLMETVILNGNSALNSVTGPLNLPVVGENGSEISWASNNVAVIAVDGTVTRPTYTQGSMTVTLTATISKGSYLIEKTFNITVRANFLTSEELIAKDYEWLTEARILNGNSSLDNVTGNLYLPTNGMDGIPGSHISWASSNHGFVTIGGNVYRPMFHLGDQTITLTATISKESASLTKTFVVVVKYLDLTDDEAVNETSKWLRWYNILGANLSGNSVTQDLSLPIVGLYDSTITWSSDRPNIISNEGVVTRPENRAGNRRVNVTATVVKGDRKAEVSYQYIVLEKPDSSAPVVISADPKNNSTGVLWDTNRITITYNDNIVLAQSSSIELKAADAIQIVTTAENNKLIITPYSALSSGENRLFIPKGVVTDAAGNPVEAYELKFTVEEKLVRNIEVISSSPYENEKEVDVNIPEIFFRFNSAEIVKGKYFDIQIALRTIGKVIPVTCTLSGDKVTMKLKESLAPATVYEIVIHQGVVQDRFLNNNSTRYIQFKTKGIPESEVVIPEVASVYPADGQTGVSVKPNIEVVFSDVQKLGNYQFKLTDATGKVYPMYAPYTLEFFETKLIFKPKESLKPNTVYTLSGPYGSAINPAQKEFSTQFTTGSGLTVIRTSPATGDWNAPTRGIVEINFNTPVTKGANYKNIVFEDYFGDSVAFVGEETGSKVVLRSLTELELYMPYTIYIPSEAYKNTAGTANDQNKISFFTTEEKLPTEIEVGYLDVPDTGFVGKAIKISADTLEMKSWVSYVRSLGYGPVSYEWSIDGNQASTKGLFYRTFSSPGDHEIRLTVKDKYGFSYEVEKTVQIKALQDVRMSLKDSGTINKISTSKTAAQSVLNYELSLEQENQFIYGETISVKLYKDGVLQRFSNYGDGGITITSKYEDDAYKFTYEPEYGDSGTYELVFAYNGLDGEQVIRQPFIVTSKEPAATDVFRFRLYENKLAKYYEELNYVYVILNGERIKANKEMYTYNGSSFPVYTLRKTLQTNTYYDFKVENWYWTKGGIPFYLGKDTDNPAILSGSRGSIGSGMKIKNITINHSESELKEQSNLYFKGMTTKLVLNVEGDWAGTDAGYYEIATYRYGEGVTRYEDSINKIDFIQAYDKKSEIQKITLKPGIQLKDDSEYYLIRLVSSQGYKSAWVMYPNYLYVLPVPSVLGKELNISVQNGEYAINWPTVFDGPIGGTIGALDGIPVIDGGNFGMGGSMPKFEGQLTPYGDIQLSFEAKGGYGESDKTSKATKYKKVKKVTVVGYEFEIELEGGISLYYEGETEEWSIWYMYIVVDGDVTKSWDKGYEFMGVGFTAGVSVGTGVYGVLIIEKENETEYSGIIRLTPHANLHVNGDFGVANVVGSLGARIPAEIHFPTGYIGADIYVDASIKATALTWSKTLYEKELYKVHWDNGKQKVILRALQTPMEKTGDGEDAGIQQMPRDYLSRQSNWLDGNTIALALQSPYAPGSFNLTAVEAKTNPKIVDLMENIFPETESVLVVNGDQQWLVWNDDNPSRDAVNRTQLRCSVFKDGVWSLPEWIYDDGTADFDPAIAPAGNGVLMAWHNIGKAVTEEEGLDEMLKNSEISVTEGIYAAGGSQPSIINLTNDDKLDHSPKIAADGDMALLVWTKSEESDFSLDLGEISSSEPGDQLYFSLWSNGTWSTPEAIEMDFSKVLDSSLSMEGEEGLLLYTLDMDNNLLTGEDREVFARLYNGSAWGEAIQLTVNELNDSAPKAVNVDGKWFITWLQEGKISYKVGLDGGIRTEELLGNIQSDYQITAKAGERPLVALVYTQPGEDMALGMYASFYDIDNRKWSDKIGLATGNKYISEISTTFTADGKLNAVFTQADIITEAKPKIIDDVEELIETKSVSNKVDLKLLTYTPVHDVSLLEEDGMFLSTEFPLPSAVTTVYVTLGNEGDFAENAAVYLFDGNPNEGGVKIAETAPQLIPARSSKEVEIAWLVGSEEMNEYDLYAVVRTNDGVQETTMDNNTVNIKVSTSDIAITDLTCENPAAGDYLINVTIANRGSRVLEGAKVWLEDEDNGEVLKTTVLETVDLGEETVLTYMIASNGRKNMNVRVTLPEGLNESNKDDNTRTFLLEPAAFVLKSLNIGPGEKQVDVTSAISIEFNMSVGEGAGFDQIRLMDEKLNEVAINKVIENSTLTIKPQNLLEYGVGYRLTIPKDALGDSYGHTLERAFDMSFTTITANPEIVSAYPGAGMSNTALDTTIRLRFNQNVMKGHEFSKIALNEHVDGSEVEAIPVSASIEGEFLTMNYAGSLRKNTTYTLEIPRGAVENERGETQREDYTLAFTTGEADGEDEEDDEDNGGQLPSESYRNEYKADISFGDTQRTVEVRREASKAVIKLGTLAEEIFSGDKEVVIDIPSIPGVSSYTVEMPAATLSRLNGKATLRIKTSVGSITIPSAMLLGMSGLEAKTAGITISAGDKVNLPADVKAAIENKPVIQLTLALDGVETEWNNMNNPVRVSIPYTPRAAELESPESIVIWHIDANGNSTTIPSGCYRQSVGAVSFSTNHFSDFAVGYHKANFIDVPDGAWYDRAISFIAAREITTGTGNGKFSPDNKLTRGQFITMLMKAYGIAPDTHSMDNFSDSGSTWYTGYLAAAKRLGISAGVGNNRFAPDKEITRQEMFALLYNALKVMKQLPETNKPDKVGLGRTLSEFTDEGEIASWAREAMTLLVETDTVSGNAEKLTPLHTTTRAEMAQVLYNLMNR
jgi:hypothetical protein